MTVINEPLEPCIMNMVKEYNIHACLYAAYEPCYYVKSYKHRGKLTVRFPST
jgi:hypothetical protein